MILAPDPAVPHRDALLDGRALGVGAARRMYAKYHVGESLRVVHRTEDGGHVAARAFAPGASLDAFERARATAGPAGVVHRPELDAVVWRFPNDRRLTGLALLAGRSPALDALAGAPVAPRLVAYCAERSATAECVDASGRVRAYAKVHLDGGAERERRRLERVAAELGDDPHLRVPRALATGSGALVVEAVAGRRLDRLDATEMPQALELLGAGLAALHERAPVPEQRFRRLDPERLAKAVGVVVLARPDAGPAAARLLAELLERRNDATGPAVCLHGDPSVRNAVTDGDRIALLDFEDVAAGPAAADLGKLLAVLPGEQAEAVLCGYARVRPLPGAPCLRWHAAASVLVRFALPAVSRVRADMLDRLRPRLEAAWR